ncbi:MAG TPA: cyclic pyranopterin monophosphate synthase MoaC [Hyphomicrobium sp.]|nr:cyclic pyranopterin monophosphate synthase MoaC [Hyphomicrobium sp.]
MTKLSHIDESGRAHMVDVGSKHATHRTAVAEGFVTMNAETLELILSGTAPKGDVLAVARIAGIMAAKKTSDLIPLCHPLGLTRAGIHFTPSDQPAGIHIRAEVGVTGQTGVEMEALTAVSVAALTLYDMLKAADRGMEIGAIRLAEKTGGRTGYYAAPPREGQPEAEDAAAQDTTETGS